MKSAYSIPLKSDYYGAEIRNLDAGAIPDSDNQ